MADVKLRDADNDQIYLADNVELIFGTGTDVNDASEGDWSMYYDGSNLVMTGTTGAGGIQQTITPSATNWGVNKITVTHPGSSYSIRGLRVDMECASGGVTVTDTQAIHGRVTISADDTTATNAAINPMFAWLILENGVTSGTGTLYAPFRAIFNAGTNDLRFGGESAAIFYGQTWATAGQIDAGLFIAAGASSTIRAVVQTGGSGTFTNGLNFATTGSGANTAWPFAVMPIQDSNSRYMKIFVGDSVTRAAVEAEYQTNGAADGYAGKGTVYISTGGEMYIKVNDAAAATDWEVFAHSAADTG